MRLVDADKLIRQLIETEGDPGDVHKYCYPCKEILELIGKQPTIEPRPRWIPVSERLPTARQSVILSTKDWTGEGCYWETTEHHVIWKGYRWNATYWDDEVIAWCPLPEPYKEEEH